MREERGGGLDRFATPLYSVAEAARYLDVPVSAFATWTMAIGIVLPGDGRWWVGRYLLRCPALGSGRRSSFSRRFGQPIFARGGTRLEDALALFRAGEPLDVVADEYGVPRDQLEDAVRGRSSTRSPASDFAACDSTAEGPGSEPGRLSLFMLVPA